LLFFIQATAAWARAAKVARVADETVDTINAMFE